MRILVSAYACEPGKGSEPGVGWNLAKTLSAKHHLTVLTRRNNEEKIRGAGEPWVEQVQWVFLDPPRWMTFWKKGNSGIQLFYVLWQICAYRKVKHLLRRESFDLAHHVTFGKYWVPSFLGYTGLPLVFGPVGGGESPPDGFWWKFSFRGKISETGRAIASWIVPRLPVFRGAYRRITYVLSATKQTDCKIKRLVTCPTCVFPQSGLSADEIANMTNITQGVAVSPFPLYVTASRLNHWKAIDLAVEAFAIVSRRLPDARLEILSTGPEQKHIQALVKRLALEKQVSFLGKLPTLNDVYEKIASATALVHPALHEAFGQACLESLALGTPVVCWKWGGPELIVADGCGVAIAPNLSRTRNIEQLAEGMLELGQQAGLRAECSTQGRKRVDGHFTWTVLGDRLEQIYRETMRGNRH